jgi:GcrA cell cycle regulator
MWDDRLDHQLIQFRNQGFSYSEIALRMGVSRNAAIGRMQRLNGKVYPSQIAVGQRKTEASRRRTAERLKTIERLKAKISASNDCNRTIREAYKAGTSGYLIAQALGGSKSRIYRIIAAQSATPRPPATKPARPVADPEPAAPVLNESWGPVSAKALAK